MKFGQEPINRNLTYIMLVMLALGLVVMLARGGGSTFFMFFWVIPVALWTTRRYSGSCDTDAAKRKNDDLTKRKNEDTEAVGTLTTIDGEVFDVIEEKPSQRHSDFI